METAFHTANHFQFSIKRLSFEPAPIQVSVSDPIIKNSPTLTTKVNTNLPILDKITNSKNVTLPSTNQDDVCQLADFRDGAVCLSCLACLSRYLKRSWK